MRLHALWDKAAWFVRVFAAHGDGTALSDTTFLELGAGRDLSVPIALRLMGVGRVISIDVARLAKLDLVRHAAAHMAAEAGLPSIRLGSWADVEAFGVEYRAPVELSSVDLPPESADCICSNEVLEHVEPEALRLLARATVKLLKRGGITVHAIDYSDHFARSDTRIDRFNFLRFDDRAWRRHNSSFQYVNRLRPSDYASIFTASGLQVLSDSATPGTATTTRRADLADRFKGYSDADLFVINGRLILGKP